MISVNYYVRTPKRILIISRSLYTLIRDKRDRDVNGNIINALPSPQEDRIIFNRDMPRGEEEGERHTRAWRTFRFYFDFIISEYVHDITYCLWLSGDNNL